MKNKVLLTSAVLVGLATSTGIGTILLAHDEHAVTRLLTVSFILGLGSIGLFFVGSVLKE